LIKNLNRFLAPIQKKYAELTARPGGIDKILDHGLEKIRPIAVETMAEVRKKTGLRPLRNP
jgi:hypothetical protein